jgi:hypothetical protein
MKNKLFLAALAAVALVTGFTTDASAARIVKEQLGWLHSGTKFDRLSVSSTFGDTTAYFSTEGWATPFNASTDTVIIGYIVVEMDTAAAATCNLTDFTSKVLVTNDGSNILATLAPGTQTLTTGTKTLTFPIWFSVSKAYRAAHINTFPFAGKAVRFLLLGGTGTMPAAKVSLVRWSD